MARLLNSLGCGAVWAALGVSCLCALGCTPLADVNERGVDPAATADPVASPPSEPTRMNPTTATPDDGSVSNDTSGPNQANPNEANPSASFPTPLDPTPVAALPTARDAGVADAGEALTPPEPCADALRFGDSCYRASATALPWTEARADCLATGADLVKLESPAEDAFVGELLDVSIWVGARDPVQNAFTWTDGTALSFDNWGNGQPNAGPEQPNVSSGPDCVEKRQEPDDERWYDQACQDSRFYICESSALP